MTFTISQQPDSTDLYLYPTSDVSSGLSPYGETNNYECVDDTVLSPDTSTYVYTTSATTVYDMYRLTNHTTETGVINYVQILNRAMSYGNEQERLGNYYVAMDCSGVTDYSSNKDITQSYADYSKLYTSQPSDASDWNWTAVDNIQSGVSCNSPQISGASVTMVYDAQGSDTNGLWQWRYDVYPRFHSVGDATNYTLVDYTDPPFSPWYHSGVGIEDGLDAGESWHDDIYLTAPDASGVSITSDVIQKVILSAYIGYSNGNYRMVNYKPSITLGGSTDYGTTKDRDTLANGQWFTQEWTSQPSNSQPWTAEAVNQMRLGYAMQIGYNGTQYIYVSALKATVYYTEDFTPEIRTTQSYARVNYVPTPTTVTLTMPESLQVSHSRQVNRHRFFTGNYEVDDYGRAGKTLSINGTEISSATANMQSLKDICHYGASVTISDLPDSNLNTDYHIVDFNFQQQGGEVDIYRWSLSLEED